MLVLISGELREMRHRACILCKCRPRGKCWQKYARGGRIAAIFVGTLWVVQKVSVVVIHARIGTVGSERKRGSTGYIANPFSDEVIAIDALQVAGDVYINGLAVLNWRAENRVVRYDVDEQGSGL